MFYISHNSQYYETYLIPSLNNQIATWIFLSICIDECNVTFLQLALYNQNDSMLSDQCSVMHIICSYTDTHH
jgi:hypothetical protein